VSFWALEMSFLPRFKCIKECKGSLKVVSECMVGYLGPMRTHMSDNTAGSRWWVGVGEAKGPGEKNSPGPKMQLLSCCTQRVPSGLV
jgi:hypothetical protein